MRRIIGMFALIIAGGCTSIPKEPFAADLVATVKAEYADHNELTVQISPNGRYSIRGQQFTLKELSFIKETTLLPDDTRIVLDAKPGTTHEDVQPAFAVMKGQFWKMAFKKE